MEATEDLRPGYHFTPARNWLNDPNGLVFHDGVWHLFFQHNPEGNVWGNMSWGHATSPDLVHWTEQPVALAHRPGELIFSGSVVVDNDNTSGFGVDDRPPLVAVYTSAYEHRQAQSLATSTDGGATWSSYDANPVLDRGSPAFRDPKVLRYDDGRESWWVLVAVEALQREVVIYRSDDLRRWTYLSAFGAGGDGEDMWECPDLFELPLDGDPGSSAWVLVVSVNPGAVAGGSGNRYFVGDFDGTTFTAAPGGEGWLDHGRDYYAAVSYDNAPDGRTVMVGWMSNWDYAHVVPTSPWRGTISLPRELFLREHHGSIELVQRPVAELGVLDDGGSGRVPEDALERVVGHTTRMGSRYRVDVTFACGATGEVGLDLLVGPGEATRLRYSTDSGLLTLDRRTSGDVAFSPSFPSIDAAPVALREGRLRLEVYVDRTSVEVFAQDGAVCLTQLVFASAQSTGLRVVADGTARIVALDVVPLRRA